MTDTDFGKADSLKHGQQLFVNLENISMEELIAAKSVAQAARAEDLMARVRAIEVYQIQKHLDEQFKYIYDKIDEANISKSRIIAEEQKLQFKIDSSVERTDYENSLIDMVQQQIKEETGDNPLKSDDVMTYARFMYHKKERKSVKECAHVLGEVIKNTLPDNTETESSSDDETEKEAFLYKTEVKDKARQYRPIASTPIAKWAKFRSQFISSWSWLDHAILDTDFRMKKTDALYEQMRKAKPPFALDSPQPSSSSVSLPPVKDIEGIAVYNNPQEATKINYRFDNSSNEEVVNPKDSILHSNPVSSPIQSKAKNALYKGFDCPSSLSFLADISVNQEYLPRDNSKDIPQKINHPGSTKVTTQTIKFPSKDAEEDVTQVASRCRALKSWKPRKIFQMNGISHFMNHVSQPIRISDCCCQLGDACLFCLGNKYKHLSEGHHQSFVDKMCFLDPSFHKSLSTPDEIPVEMLMYKTLEDLEGNETTEEMNSFQQFKSTGPDEERLVIPKMDTEDEETSPFEIIKRGRGRPRSRNIVSPDFSSELNDNYPPKKSSQSPREKKNKKSYGRNRRKRAMDYDDTDEDDEPYEKSMPSTSTTAAFKRLSSRKKRDFDNNHIVIPSHITATTRLEKLEYKEIITPCFREARKEPILNPDLSDLRPPKKPGIKRDRRFLKKINEDFEDLDDETIISRHGRCEEEEKRKFSTAVNKKTNRRRRLKSKSETTDAVNDKGSNVADNAEVISSEDASLAATAVKVHPGRRRTISASRKEEEEIEECLIAPFPRRQFPLTEDIFDEMADVMPEGHVN